VTAGVLLLAALLADPRAGLRGRVLAAGQPLAGASVCVVAGGQVVAEAASDALGRFELAELSPGPALLRVRLPGFRPFEAHLVLTAGEPLEREVELRVEGVAEQVVVTYSARADSLAASLGPREELQGLMLERPPSGGDTVQDALVTLPGVVRSGETLSIRGGRPAQSSLQLGSMLLSDPATGEARLRLPVDAVASVEVMPSPTAAEFGRFSSGVVVMHPRGGGDSWRFALRNPDPTLRFKRGEFLEPIGIRSFAPRVALSGPLRVGAVHLAQSLQYRYTASDVSSRPEDELSVQEYVSSVTRIDAQLSPRHTLAALVSIFPERRSHVGLGTYVPPEVAVDQRLGIYNASLSETAALGSSALLESAVHAGRQELELGPPEAGVLVLQPQGQTGRAFNRQHRRADSLQWVETLSLTRSGRLGEHAAQLGLDVLHADFHGSSSSTPVEVRSLDGRLLRRVEFGAATPQHVATTDVALFARERWRPWAPLLVEAGLRLDRDGVTRRSVLAPRLGAQLEPGGSRLTLRGSVGVFGERTPSLVGAFESLEERTETRLDQPGAPTTTYRNTRDGDLQPARSTTWTAELLFRASPRLQLRAGVLGRAGRDEPIVRLEPAALLLSTEGRSRYRELELSARFAPRPRSELHVSWVHSRSEANLNAFSALFGSARAPVIRPDEYGPAPVDVPDRLLLRLRSEVGEWFVAALLDARAGFPWSAVDGALDFVGPRNRAGRFPSAALLDVAVERRFRVGRWQPWVGVGVVNALNSFAPREVQANVTAPDFGAFSNDVPRRLQLFLRLDR
jgi:hypothetical protein